MFATVFRVTAVASQPSAHLLLATRHVAPKAFASHASSRKDILTDLYLREIRAYKPPAEDRAAAASLPESVPIPAPPPKPEFELVEAQAVDDTVALEEAEWPPLVDPIDDPHNYPDAWDYTTDKIDNKLMPTAVKPYDYHGDH
ncbi:hypothetical protein SeLEV6574_g04520 [Synchytrium endobioticum]|nr:hypothetical protein SeLEV6574_g04520 [Synchytrium endobioticum]